MQLEPLFMESMATIGRTSEYIGVIEDMAYEVVRSVRNGGKLMVCGNGGSCADADHLVAELLVRLTPSNNRDPIPAISLTMDNATLTACANDYGYDEHFARMVKALGNPGDVLLVISTSGNSTNIIRAVNTARAKGIYTMGLLGSGGGCVECDMELVVPSSVTGRIQEAHAVVIHALAESIEEELCTTVQTT